MPFSRLLILVITYSSIALATLPSDLVFVPSAIFPTNNQSELGYQFTYFPIASETDYKGFYFNHSFTDSFRYGVEYYENDGSELIYHHYAFRIGSFLQDSGYESHFSGGINYLSADDEPELNKTIYDGYITQTLTPKDIPFQFHITGARQASDYSFVLIGAISYVRPWGTLQLEWDNNFLNIGSKIKINNRLIFRNGITKNINDNSEIVLKSSFGFIDFNNHETHTHDEVEEKQKTTETAVGLGHLQDGIEYYYQSEYKKALKSYKLALQFFPQSAVVHERLGSIYYKLGDLHTAKLQWEKANSIEPSAKLRMFIQDVENKIESTR